MAKATIKCRQCGARLDRSKATKHPDKKNMYFCSQECLELYYDPEHTSKTDFVKLTDYLQELYTDEEANWPLLTSQIKRLESEGFKLSGILMTLKYCYETLGFTLDRKYGIERVVTGFYEVAKKNWIDTVELEEKYMDFDEDEVIIMKSSQQKTKKTRRKIIEPM